MDAAQLWQDVKDNLPGALPDNGKGRAKAAANCTLDEIVDALNAYVAGGCGRLDRRAALRPGYGRKSRRRSDAHDFSMAVTKITE